ncbi:MAG: membrane-bound O-acyltransferase family protein [Rhodobacteraceae bacterium]|nr:membrane-bound O-acyltransferase family protein [Paracoccaceae bacterium]
MVFSSESFLFLFLPLFLALYYLTPTRWKSATILLGSYTFYGWWRVDFLGLLILTTLWTYGCGLLIRRNLDGPRARLYCGIGVAGCLAVLGVFKYLNFFVDSLAALVGTDASGLGIHWRLILPIGISFYVFQSISYLVDVYRKDVKATVSFLDFAAFIALFPQLIAGPILRFKDLAHQFEARTHSAQMFTDGARRFAIGLAKKVILADAVAPLADLAFSTTDPSMPLAWIGAVAYMLQLYFDFSGYSDMAIGLGMMMGFRFTENFNRPYISRSITEFWRRWHISLSVWLRDYLYIPLGGNRLGTTRTYVNLMTVMLLGGFWHGANWTFLVWGAWHGGWLALERATGRDKGSGAMALISTLLVVLIGWVVFRAETLGIAFGVYSGMLGFNGGGIPVEIAMQITRESLLFVGIGILVVIAESWVHPPARSQIAPDGTLTLANTLVPSVAITGIATFTIMKLAEQNFSPFLYFQF